MRKLLIPIAILAVALAPAAADAAGQCRNASNGKFAKCGTPGAVPAAQYVAKGKSKAAKPAPAAPASAPSAAATPKPSLFGGLAAKLKKPAPAAAPAKPAAKPAKCKDAKGKFIKCK